MPDDNKKEDLDDKDIFRNDEYEEFEKHIKEDDDKK
jgi:hypothetical protein